MLPEILAQNLQKYLPVKKLSESVMHLVQIFSELCRHPAEFFFEIVISWSIIVNPDSCQDDRFMIKGL